jgi:hypothetical protein
VDCFGDANPDIEEADAGEDAADGAETEEGLELRVVENDGVVLPDTLPPGKKSDHGAEIEAEDDQDEERETLQPDGCGLGDLRGWGVGLGGWLEWHRYKLNSDDGDKG